LKIPVQRPDTDSDPEAAENRDRDRYRDRDRFLSPDHHSDRTAATPLYALTPKPSGSYTI